MIKKTLLVSVGLNIVAVVAIATLMNREPVAVPSGERVTAVNAKAAVASPGGAVQVTEPMVVVENFHWSSIESDDFKEYIANMRRVGVPEETIRDIVYTDVSKIYSAKMRPFGYVSSTNRKEYWKYRKPYSSQSPEQLKEYNLLKAEREDALKALLGDDYRSKMAEEGAFRPSTAYDYIPKDKREALASLVSRYATEERTLFAKTGSSVNLMKADQAELNRIRGAKQEELATLLTPEEFHAFNIRTSRTSSMMRHELMAFEPSRQEFDEIFKIRDEFAKAYGDYPSISRMKDEERRQYSADRKALDQSIGDLLGEDRFAEYKKSTDYKYREIYKLTDRFELGKAAADEVWKIKSMAESKAAEFTRQRGLSPTERRQALATLQQETQNAVRSAIGEEAFENFTGYGASWMERLSVSRTIPRSPTAATSSGSTSSSLTNAKRIEMLERMLKRLRQQAGE